MPSVEGLRIVSLLPAATELVYALGRGRELVGVSHECDHPPAARSLPRVTSSRIEPTASAARIQAQVQAGWKAGHGPIRIDGERLRTLAPDLILTQGHCAVCSLTPADLAETTRGWPRTPQILRLDAHDLGGVLEDVRRVGRALDRNEEAKLLLFRLWRTTKAIRAKVQGLTPVRTAFLDWADPPMAAGNWIPELVAMAGGDARLVEPGSPSRWTSWAELVDLAPDVIVVAPCGRSTREALDEAQALLADLKPGTLPAWDQGRVFAADGHHFFNRPGPRLVYSAAILARCFHPEAVPPLPTELERHVAQVPTRPLPPRANPH